MLSVPRLYAGILFFFVEFCKNVLLRAVVRKVISASFDSQLIFSDSCSKIETPEKSAFYAEKSV